jgi:hypothetical protein
LDASHQREIIPASCNLALPQQNSQIYQAPMMPRPIAPGNPRRAPDADLPSGGDITMTIKGPIHIAGFDDAQAEPEFIFGPLKTK